MPPRKRRQSAQGEEILKENVEGAVSPVGVGTESGKQVKNVPKTPDTNSQPERRLTARQQSKQDALQESYLAGKSKDPAVPSTSAAETSAKQPTRFSTRIVKRPRRDLSPPESPVKKGKKVAAVPPVTTTPETKGKRQWELWSVEDKDSFFEGLCEYGKDFESIHNLIVNKCKKKGGVLPITVKNKEQVRHFYYRTWHKISKLIQPVEDLKKDIQELYGLISYSVLRKKLRGGVNPNDKNWQKLNDLVHQGIATIKVKGKRIRVKTPVCSALKKLNCFEEPKRDPGAKVPEKIRVEFRPKTNIAWQHVQDVSHNPRVRVTVRSERHLQSLVKYLEQKWKPPRLKLRESLTDGEQGCEEFRVYPHRDSTLRNISMEAIDEPVLQFCLNKHCKDNIFSPSTSKRKKDKEVPVKTSSVCTNTENSPDSSKAVISEPCCACNDACNNCAFKCLKSCGPSNDLVKSCASKDAVKLCSCMCNKDKIGLEKHSLEKVIDGSNFMEGEGHKDPPARSLFSAITESSKSVKIPSDVSDIKCVLAQNESPKYRSDEVTPSLSSSRTFSVPDLSEMVDGENAMFPDTIGDNCQEASIEVTVSENNSDAKVEQDVDGNGCFGATKYVPNVITSGEVEKNCNKNMANAESSQTDFEKVFKGMLDNGWGVDEGDNLTLAELYLMFGEDGELKFEYDWVSLRREAELLQEKLLINLNNMLRRLSHLAMIEFTDFTKSSGANTTCQLCGQSPSKKSHGRGKDKSPVGSARASKPGKDASTQTQGLRLNPTLIGPGISTPGQNGVFRIPVLPAPVHSQPKTTTTVVTQPSKEQLARYNPTHNTTQKQLMRPRKLKPMSRSRPGTAGSLVQRTILPKNSEYITIIPMMPGTQIPNPSPEKTTTETIVGHPINGIQKHPITVMPSSPSVSVSMRNPVLLGSPSVTTSPSTDTSGLMEMSLSPEGDQTLLRIPAAHLGSMSQEALKAAGLSTMPGTPISVPISVSTTPVTMHAGSYSLLATSTAVTNAKGSLSPPNLSALLDISLPTGDLETDTTFSGLLEDNKTLTLDPGLTTPPIGAITEHQPQKSEGLHSPPVRSLFQTSPTPDQQWLTGDVQDLSLSSFLDTPSRPATSSSGSMFNPNMPMSLFNENSRDFQSHRIDVDTTLQSMMNESSMDYVKKFADLAEQIVQNDSSTEHTKKPV
ncbi:protein cramped-like [Mercenaria mercenaria]|uniref:protein cramped-like n=1 Tax=Mercenaria mercenaria TaxID=6596 RepID=UPI00234EEA3A|nr:protein cramped-like [Mercenaria mercenaria]